MASGQPTRDTEWQTPPTAWLFDVDGVLTDPESKRVLRDDLFEEILKRLARHEPVGLNTGRSARFVLDQVLHPLETRTRDRSLLSGLVGIGEKGGVWIDYTADGTSAAHLDSAVAMPQDLQEAVRALIEKPPYAETMFFDETKQTMISTELRLGRSVDEYAAPQRRLVEDLRALLAAHPLGPELRLDANRIATDVEYRRMGKGYGAERYMALLAKRGIQPGRFVCFGDSASDYDMLEALLRLGARAELVFVGEERYLLGKDTRHVTFTSELCDAGTLSYLRAHP